MTFNIYYYDSNVTCHCCKKNYTTYKVRPGRYKAVEQDTDFMTIYEGLNPMLYEVNVCPHCGYAYHKSMTRTYGPFMLLVKEIYINQLQKVMNLCGERTIDEAIASFKLAYLVAKATMEENLILANFAMKIAWLYRVKKDHTSELNYLRSARELYTKSFASNRDGEERLIYLHAELSLRLGDVEEAKRTFSRLITGREFSNKYRNLAKKRWENYKDEQGISERDIHEA